MVNNFLLVLLTLSFVIWIFQEWRARRVMRENFAALMTNGAAIGVEDIPDRLSPPWNEWLIKFVVLMWLAWGASILILKDGDFALILVLLTLFSGLVSGLDRWCFSRGRQSFADSGSVMEYLAKYGDEKRELVRHVLTRDYIVAEYAKSFFPVLAVVLVLRSFIIEPFQIPSASMVPTLQVGDYILVNKFTYGVRLPVIGTKIIDTGEPKRGDVMVFFPPNDSRYFIKRVIGLPGDHIHYENKQLYINGKPAGYERIAQMPPLTPVIDLISEHLGNVDHMIYNDRRAYSETVDVVVKPGHYFMMGDNRDNSSDSRVWGQVPEKNIVGRAFAVWMHWGSITELPKFNRAGLIQ